VPVLCSAKLPHATGFCQKLPAKGANRCLMHGGRSTGPRSPAGMTCAISKMIEGRARWAANLKAKGKRFPNSRKGRHNRTPEERAALAQAKADRAATRRRYSDQQTQLKTLKSKSRAIRSLLPQYIKKSDFDNPHVLARIEQASELAGECLNIPNSERDDLFQAQKEGDKLAENILDVRFKIMMSVCSVQLDIELELERRQKEREEKEQWKRFSQMSLRLFQEKAERDRQLRITEQQANAWANPCLPPWQEEELRTTSLIPDGYEDDDPVEYHSPFADRVYGKLATVRRTSQGHDPEPWHPQSAHPRVNRSGSHKWLLR
jgi:hypothetical protein